MGLTYGVDLDSGPDRQIHGLVHGVSIPPSLTRASVGKDTKNKAVAERRLYFISFCESLDPKGVYAPTMGL